MPKMCKKIRKTRLNEKTKKFKESDPYRNKKTEDPGRQNVPKFIIFQDAENVQKIRKTSLNEKRRNKGK